MDLNALQKFGTNLINTKVLQTIQIPKAINALPADTFQKSALSGLEGYSKKVQDEFLSTFESLLRGETENKEKLLAIFKKRALGQGEEKNILRYLKNIQALNSKQTPKGEHILNISDTLYLADARLTKEQKLQFKKIMQCAQEGYIPASVLNKGLFGVSDGINPKFLEDYDRLIKAKEKGTDVIDEIVPEFESRINAIRSDSLDKLEPGTFVSFKHGNNGKRTLEMKGKDSSHFSELSIDREAYFDIMSPIKRYYVKQGQSGTCYQLASYISYLNHPKAQVDLVYRLHQEDGKIITRMPYGSQSENMFKGRFADFTKDGTVLAELTQNNKGRWVFTPPDKKQSVQSNALIASLEHLYGKKRKYEFADKYVRQMTAQGIDAKKAFDEAFLGMENYIYQQDSKGRLTRTTLEEINREILAKNPNGKTFSCPEDFYKEGGTSCEIFEFLGADKCQKPVLMLTSAKTDKTTLDSIRKILSTDKESTIKCFGTIPAGKGVENGLLPKKYLYSSHGYSILDYNPETDIITYINPWNSAFTHQMPLKDMAQYINQISVMKIR